MLNSDVSRATIDVPSVEVNPVGFASRRAECRLCHQTSKCYTLWLQVADDRDDLDYTSVAITIEIGGSNFSTNLPLNEKGVVFGYARTRTVGGIIDLYLQSAYSGYLESISHILQSPQSLSSGDKIIKIALLDAMWLHGSAVAFLRDLSQTCGSQLSCQNQLLLTLTRSAAVQDLSPVFTLGSIGHIIHFFESTHDDFYLRSRLKLWDVPRRTLTDPRSQSQLSDLLGQLEIR